MKTLICTPAAGGMLTTKYVTSLIETLLSPEKIKLNHEARLKKLPEPYEIGHYTLANESLIGRGRNHCAQVAMDGGWDRLFFIDADVGWKWEQFKIVLDSCDAATGRGISAGACPLKTYPISLNFLPFKEGEKFFEMHDNLKSPEGMVEMGLASQYPMVEIPLIGTAFMCIDVAVLFDLKETRPFYMYPNPYTGEPTPHWDLFPTGPIENKFVSEDWSFCHYAREIGHKVWLNTDICVTHTGPHTFGVNLVEIEDKINAAKRLEKINAEKNVAAADALTLTEIPANEEEI